MDTNHNDSHLGSFPRVRMRRSRNASWSRNLVAETSINVHDLVWPLFVQEGENQRTGVGSMPGIERLTIDILVKEVEEASKLGISAIALFPVIDSSLKTDDAKEAYNPDNLLCRAIRAIKKKNLEIGIIADVALDPYTSHGQDGLVKDGEIVNDPTIDVLCKQAIVLAEAGADVVAPSDMMDGRIGAIRDALDEHGHQMVQILSYAAKYASCFYGPFRDAVGSADNLAGGSKASYQMSPRNGEEAIREVALDVAEGADIIMVKPGMIYLDVVRHVAEHFSMPVFAYQVSGEYSMIEAAAEKGWVDKRRAQMEALIAFKRAGATAIVTYSAKEVAEWLVSHTIKHTDLMR